MPRYDLNKLPRFDVDEPTPAKKKSGFPLLPVLGGALLLIFVTRKK